MMTYVLAIEARGRYEDSYFALKRASPTDQPRELIDRDRSHLDERAKLDAARETEVGSGMASVQATQPVKKNATKKKASAGASSTFVLAVDTPPMEARAAEVIRRGPLDKRYFPLKSSSHRQGPRSRTCQSRQ
jgi:hypothetical protein